MKKTVIIVILIILAAGGVWYYFSQVLHTPIEKILSNPKAYEGKEVTVEGEVTDRTAFFVVLKFFKVRDKSGEIIVVTKKSLPELRSIVGIKGKVDDSFAIGDQKIVVFVEESMEVKGKNK